jgi:hypothetical protein
MPKYFLHLRDSTDEVLDPEGIELPTEAVPGAALIAARDCMAGDVKDGQLDLRYRIDVHDDSGELVHSLPFPDAVEIVPASQPA